jgi:hypothetical protein
LGRHVWSPFPRTSVLYAEGRRWTVVDRRVVSKGRDDSELLGGRGTPWPLLGTRATQDVPVSFGVSWCLGAPRYLGIAWCLLVHVLYNHRYIHVLGCVLKFLSGRSWYSASPSTRERTRYCPSPEDQYIKQQDAGGHGRRRRGVPSDRCSALGSRKASTTTA